VIRRRLYLVASITIGGGFLGGLLTDVLAPVGYLLMVAAGAAAALWTLAWLGASFGRPRLTGSVISVRTVLGTRAIDLHDLRSVATSVGGRRAEAVLFLLRDEHSSITLAAGATVEGSGKEAVDLVEEAVVKAQEAGRLIVARNVARVLGLEPLAGAPRMSTAGFGSVIAVPATAYLLALSFGLILG
jgi:hypothetical protein